MMKNLKHLLLRAYIAILNLLPLKDMIVFESQSDMDDNPRAVFDYMMRTGLNQRYRLAWIVKDAAGCQKKYADKNVVFVSRSASDISNQLKLQDILSRSRWFVFSHPWWYHKRRREQIVINTDHGLPFKGATADQRTQESFDRYLSPSPLAGEWACRFWHMPYAKIMLCGAPRNDELFAGDKASVLSRFFDYGESEKVVICMPTYRQSVIQKDCGKSDPYCLDIIENQEEFEKADRYLQEKSIHLLIKPHPLQIAKSLVLKDGSNIHYIDNRMLAHREIKLYQLIGCCDALLTDLSSVFFDYLLLNRPIGFLTKDLKDYERGFVVDNPLDYMPGKRVETLEDFFGFIDDLLEARDPWERERRRVSSLINGEFTTNSNCEFFVTWMLKQ